jgi:hypothetical protein
MSDTDDEAGLPDLEWLIHEDNANSLPMDVDNEIDRDDKADLAWVTGEENTLPPEYYLDQENNSDESEDEDEDYSNGSLLLLDMIKGQFHRYVPCSFCLPSSAIISLISISLQVLQIHMKGSCLDDAGHLSPYT